MGVHIETLFHSGWAEARNFEDREGLSDAIVRRKLGEGHCCESQNPLLIPECSSSAVLALNNHSKTGPYARHQARMEGVHWKKQGSRSTCRSFALWLAKFHMPQCNRALISEAAFSSLDQSAALLPRLCQDGPYAGKSRGSLQVSS